jgi:hypothetical protein
MVAKATKSGIGRVLTKEEKKEEAGRRTRNTRKVGTKLSKDKNIGIHGVGSSTR